MKRAKLRHALAIAIVCSAPALELGSEARAEPLAARIVEAPRPASDLTLPFGLPSGALGSPGTWAATRPLPPPEALRSPSRTIALSPGAKTAIIVTAIVVGVLIIAGVVAVGHPHRPF